MFHPIQDDKAHEPETKYQPAGAREGDIVFSGQYGSSVCRQSLPYGFAPGSNGTSQPATHFKSNCLKREQVN